MKAMSLILGIVAASLLPIGCGKEDPMTSQSATDGLFSVSPAASGDLVYVLRNTKLDYEMNFYGEFDGTNNLTGIKSATLSRLSNRDTTYNYIFDAGYRVKSLFVSVKGTVLPYLLKLSYANDFAQLTSYHLNWQTGVVDQEESVLLNVPAISVKKILTGRNTTPPGPNMVNLCVDGAMFATGLVAVTGAVVVIAGGAPVVLPAILLFSGAKLIAKGYPGFKEELENYNANTMQELTTQLANDEVPDAPSAEIEAPATTPVGPLQFLKSLLTKNPEIEWCAHAVVFEYPYWPIYISGNKVINYGYLDPAVTTNAVDSYTTITKPNQFPVCTGPSTDNVLGSRKFLLKPGASMEYSYSYSTALCVINPAVYSVTLQFDCPE